MQHLLTPLTKAALRKHYADLAQMEDILRDSDLDWTAIRPPRLTDKPLTGTYRTAYGQNLRHGIFIARGHRGHRDSAAERSDLDILLRRLPSRVWGSVDGNSRRSP